MSEETSYPKKSRFAKIVPRNLVSLLRKQWRSIAIVVLVVVLAGGAWLTNHHRQRDIDAKKRAIITYSPNTPDETKPDKATYKWYGQPTDPKYITLPSIKAEGFLQKVGVDQNKQVATPGNIFMAGWFVDTVRPGQKGLSVIDGHVNGIKNAGIFKNIAKLEKGDNYSIEFGDGSKQSFAVTEVKDVPVADAASVLFSQDPAVTNQLNLITCSGKFNQKTRQYENRVIVISKAI